jgi:two-component system cell cycle sensor histidine kinase/response regulator CckA
MTSAGGRAVARLCAALSLAIGAAVLASWIFGLRPLTGLSPEFIPMAPNTALSFLLLGAATILLSIDPQSPARRAAARLLAAAIALVASVRIVELAGLVELGSDYWIYRASEEVLRMWQPSSTLAPVGRMALPTAMTFVCAGASIVFLSAPTKNRGLAGGSGFLVLCTGLVFALGYAYGAPLLYGGRAIPMALTTAIAFAIAGAGLTALAGPSAPPMSLLSGASLSAGMRRAFLPVAVASVLVAPAAMNLAVRAADPSYAALLSAVVVLGTAALMAGVAERFARMVERRIAAAEGRAEATERNFRLFMDHSPAIAFLKDEAGRYAFVNRAFEEAIAIPAGRAIGRTDRELWPDASRDLAAVEEHDRGVLASGAPAESQELLPGAGKSERRNLSLLRFALVQPDGRRTLAGIGIDMTDRLVLEEQYRQAQKMEAVGRLAGGVAHDFNNILTAVNGYTALLLDRTDLPADARENLEEVRKAGERAAGLARQLLALSHKQTSEPRIVDLNRVVEDVHKMLKRLIGEDIDFEILLEPQLGPVLADPGQIEQILMNLAVNARDAMPDGGKLTIQTSNVELDAEYASRHANVKPGSYVSISVTDTGAGMTPEVRARLFEPFYTTKEKGKGTGLGLSIVYGIVKQSGGHIWVYSEPGRGTSFKIHIPRADATAGAGAKGPAGPAPASPVEGGRETVLVVEDDAQVRELAQAILAGLGYRVIAAEDGERGLKALTSDPNGIDAAVIDVILPGAIPGAALAERISATSPRTRVILVSGYPSQVAARHGLVRPETAFLQKPFTPGALARKIREALDSQPAGA